MTLGYSHPDNLLAELTSEQVSEWEAYFRLDPFSEDKEDLRFGSLCSFIVNIARSVWCKKGTKMTTATDFIPKWNIDLDLEEKPKKQTVKEMKRILMTIANIHRRKK